MNLQINFIDITKIVRMSGIEPLLTAYQTVFLPLKDIRATPSGFEPLPQESKSCVLTVTPRGYEGKIIYYYLSSSNIMSDIIVNLF